MRSTKSIILIVIALGCGLIASIGISQVMENRANSTSPVDTVPIYVAAAHVPSYQLLTPQQVEIEEWPKDKVPQGAARTLEEFEGMRPKVPLYPGEPIMMGKLSDGSSGSASSRIPEGMQVFAVKVDKESALSGLILPGDRVDVLVFISGRSQHRLRTGTRTILRNVSVFAVNDQIGRETEEEGKSIDAKTVSLLVEPQHSERLLLAKQLGTIHLALRKPGDETDIDTKGALPGDLDDSDEGAEWSSSLAQSGQSNPSGGIFDILNDTGAASSKAVDTSIAAVDSAHEMVIMSPQGVLESYSFAQANPNVGGLSPLPRELLGAFSGAGAPSEPVVETTDSDEGPSDDDAPAPEAEDDDGDAGVDVDPADLGL